MNPVMMVSLVLGSFCLYGALFLYETEEGEIQNKLQDWWVRVDDLRKSVSTRQAVFLQSAATATTRAFEAVFGRKLLSSRALAVSSLLSLSSFELMASWFLHPKSGWLKHLFWGCAFGVAPLLLRRTSSKAIVSAAVGLVVVFLLTGSEMM